jgi:hypothetical protein
VVETGFVGGRCQNGSMSEENTETTGREEAPAAGRAAALPADP